MNKQELIESIAHLPSDCSRPRPMIDKITALELIKLLDEPQKVTVPQLVADWYEEHKENFDSKLWVEIYKFGTVEKSELAKWIYKTKNSISTIVNMHQFGYTVEKEPKYTVKIKSVNQYLVRNTDEDFLGFLQSRLKSKFTRKELEDSGLEEVFNSPLFEVEEVE
jgi:gp178